MLFTAYYTRRSSEKSLIQGPFWITWFCFLNCAISLSYGEDVNCCSNDGLWQNSTICSDGSSIRLQCPFGFFKYDPVSNKNDNFSVVEESGSSWLLLHSSLERIPIDRFCIADLHNGRKIALNCFEEPAETEPRWKDVLFSTLTIISAAFLATTLAVYIILPELRDTQGKAMMFAIASFAVGYTVLAIQRLQPQQENDFLCVTLAFMLYYAFIAAFFWLNIVSFNIWRSVWYKRAILNERILFTIFCIFGWGGPTCFLIAALAAHHTEGYHLKPRFGEYSCWFGGTKEVWAYFYGPIAILLTLNIVYLSLTSWRLWHEYRDYSGSKIRVLRFKCLLYLKLMLVTGVTWVFEVLSFAIGSKEYWIFTDIFNTLQGVVIFLLLVVTRKRVRKLLAKKKPFGINFPKSWIAYEDEECEDVLPEELELSQQG